jgi:hypothetical protein
MAQGAEERKRNAEYRMLNFEFQSQLVFIDYHFFLQNTRKFLTGNEKK